MPAMKYSCITAFVGCILLIGCTGAAQKLSYESIGQEVSSEPWKDSMGEGLLLSSSHFRIYTTATDKGIIDFMPGFMEAAYKNYGKLTGIAPSNEKPGKIYMLCNRQQWEALTKKIVRERPESYLTIQAGGYCYRGTCVFWDIGFMQTLPVAAHEGMHQYLLNNLKDTLPMWLEEGLAVMAEGFRFDDKRIVFMPEAPWVHISDLRVALRGSNWVPLGRLLEMDAGDAIAGTNEQAIGYYAQLWALLLYIRSNDTYRAGMEKLLADAKNGNIRQELGMSAIEFGMLQMDMQKYNRRISERIFNHYIAKNTAEFEKGYRAFSQSLVRREQEITSGPRTAAQ